MFCHIFRIMCNIGLSRTLGKYLHIMHKSTVDFLPNHFKVKATSWDIVKFNTLSLEQAEKFHTNELKFKKPHGNCSCVGT